MPFAIAIGPEPICCMVAGSMIPYGISEVEVAGGLRGQPVEVVKCETVDLYVPARAEIVIEGEMPPKERVPEGPFGEFTGYRASFITNRPVYKIKAITHRNDPILTVSCMGVPVDEDHSLHSLTSGAEMLDELREKGVPVTGLHCYAESSFQLLVVSVKRTGLANIAYIVSNTVRANKAGRFLPYVLVVDDDIDPGNIYQVIHALATKCHPDRGIQKQIAATGHDLQPYLNAHERQYGIGAVVTFDCTWPIDWDPETEIPKRSSFDTIYPKEIQEHVLKNWGNYGYNEGIPVTRP